MNCIFDYNNFTNLTPKYQKLKDHIKWNTLINQYIETKYNIESNHDWINFITYYKKDNKIFIFFRKFKIISFLISDKITKNNVEILFTNLLSIIKENNIMLPICYLFDIININKTDIHYILQKKNNDNKIQINFRLVNKKIIFFVKFVKFFECNINDLHNNLDSLYTKYKEIERKKQKIIFLIDISRFLNCEDTLYELQKFFYEKGYWLDISFHYNENRFQNRCQFSNYLFYFIKYDIILLYSNFAIVKNMSFENINNKLIITMSVDLTPDRLFGQTPISDYQNISKNNIIYWGKKKLEDTDNFIRLKSNQSMPNQWRNLINITTGLYDNKVYFSNKYKNPINIHSTVYINNLKPLSDDRNENILSKKDFFDMYDFDTNKKLITIFLRWPKCLFSDTKNSVYNTQRDFYIEENFINTIVENLKDDYNILFKGHPHYFTTINNTSYFGDSFNRSIKKYCFFGYHNDTLILKITQNKEKLKKIMLSHKLEEDNCRVKWYKDSILIKENVFELTIKNIKNSDIGTYKMVLPDYTSYKIKVCISKNESLLDISECNKNNSYFYVENFIDNRFQRFVKAYVLHRKIENNIIMNREAKRRNDQLLKYKCKEQLYYLLLKQKKNLAIPHNFNFIWKHNKYPGLRNLDRYKFFTSNYENELYKYTNFGFTFMDTTTALDCSLYNIPVLLISLKDKSKDWFNKYKDKKCTSYERKRIIKIYNNIDIFQESIWNEGIDGICGSIKIYWDDIKDNVKYELQKILENEKKYKKLFHKENPNFGISHISSQDQVGKKIIEVINKHGFNKISNIKYNLCQEAVTVYQKLYIDVLIDNNTINIKILKNPLKNPGIDDTLVSSGVNFYIYCVKNLCKLNFEFDINLDCNEKNVYVRLYTGIKWITYKDISLSNDFKHINFTEDFNLENKSKWRISTTSKHVGQSINIKNLNIKLV